MTSGPSQPLDARKDAHLWSERYDRDLGGMLALQSEVAQAVAAEARASVTPEEREALRAPRVDPRAYDAYVRGLELLRREEKTLEAVRAFERAVELDPGFAQAYAQLATSRILCAAEFLRPPEERAGMMAAAILSADLAGAGSCYRRLGHQGPKERSLGLLDMPDPTPNSDHSAPLRPASLGDLACCTHDG